MNRNAREGTRRINIDGIEFCYVPAPHISDRDDWHSIYIEKINALLDWDESDSNAIPEYPPLTDARLDDSELLYETGAYWEGCLHFMKKVLFQDDFLGAIDRVLDTPMPQLPDTHWKLFAAIWNSEGQLEWLKAHLARRRISRLFNLYDIDWESEEAIRRQAAASDSSPLLEWLADFVRRNRDEGWRFPNPYFGGTNPLHLGLILEDFRD